MKTTMDLPEDLVRKLKVRAARDRRKLKDLAAEFLREGLAASAGAREPVKPVIVKDRASGLPVIQCRRAPARSMTPEQVADLMLEQDADWALGAEDEG
jgi:plasmid stability protein